jgi:hypothetical protein
MHNLLRTKFHISKYKQQILNIRPTLLYFPSLCIMQLARDKINKGTRTSQRGSLHHWLLLHTTKNLIPRHVAPHHYVTMIKYSTLRISVLFAFFFHYQLWKHISKFHAAENSNSKYYSSVYFCPKHPEPNLKFFGPYYACFVYACFCLSVLVLIIS